MFCRSCQQKLFFKISEKLLKIKAINKTKKNYDEENKVIICTICKEILRITEANQEIEVDLCDICKDIIDKKKIRKCIYISLYFNWLTMSNIPLREFCEKYPKFKNVLSNKLNEFENEELTENCIYWKGKNFYQNKF